MTSLIATTVLSLAMLMFSGAYVSAEETLSMEELRKAITEKNDDFVFTVHADSKNNGGSAVVEDAYNNATSLHRRIGTAVLLDSEGYLVTLRSVIQNAEDVLVVSENGVEYYAEILKQKESCKVSVLKIAVQHPESMPELCNLSTIEHGEEVFLHTPLDGHGIYPATVEQISTMDGTITVKTRGYMGTSGSPVYDDEACLLGLVAYRVGEKTASIDTDGEQSFVIIPMKYAALLARSIINTSRNNSGWLGITLRIKPDQNSMSAEGVEVVSVIEGSPAKESGIQPGDRIIAFEGQPVHDANDIVRLLSHYSAGDEIKIRTLRGHTAKNLKILLSPYPEEYR